VVLSGKARNSASEKPNPTFAKGVQPSTFFLWIITNNYVSRMKTENEKNADSEPPHKKARCKYVPYQAKHAQDMSPMTLERAKLKGGWVVTDLGRMHRPLRMRPPRPLPPIPPTSSNSRKESEGQEKVPMKMQKHIKKPDVRARMQKIDMVRYGSEYLKGRFLEVDHPFSMDSRAGQDDWFWKESTGSDVDDISFKQAPNQPLISQSNSDHFVPQGDYEAAGEDVDVEMEDISSELKEKTPEDLTVEQRVPEAPETSNKLRDLFAPAENEGMWSHISMIGILLLVGTFSLLGHLNLDDDLELDEDVPFSINQEANDLSQDDTHVSEQTICVPRTTAAVKIDSHQARQITFDPSQPFFFPLALLATHPLADHSSFVHKSGAKNRPKDPFEMAREKSWEWPSSGFHRTQTEDQIRQRWEEQKGELTQGWKKRCREAGRIRKRRGKVGEGDDEY